MNVQKLQIESFGPAVLRQFESRALEHARRCYPAQTAALADAELIGCLGHAVRQAPAYGLTTEQQVVCFFDTMILLGPAFDRDPNHKWALRVLNNRGYSADYRSFYLLSRACRINNDAAGARGPSYGGY